MSIPGKSFNALRSSGAWKRAKGPWALAYVINNFAHLAYRSTFLCDFLSWVSLGRFSAPASMQPPSALPAETLERRRCVACDFQCFPKVFGGNREIKVLLLRNGPSIYPQQAAVSIDQSATATAVRDCGSMLNEVLASSHPAADTIPSLIVLLKPLGLPIA